MVTYFWLTPFRPVGASESKTVFARATTDYCNIYDPTSLSFKAGDTIMVSKESTNFYYLKIECIIFTLWNANHLIQMLFRVSK